MDFKILLSFHEYLKVSDHEYKPLSAPKLALSFISAVFSYPKLVFTFFQNKFQPIKIETLGQQKFRRGGKPMKPVIIWQLKQKSSLAYFFAYFQDQFNKCYKGLD